MFQQQRINNINIFIAELNLNKNYSKNCLNIHLIDTRTVNNQRRSNYSWGTFVRSWITKTKSNLKNDKTTGPDNILAEAPEADSSDPFKWMGLIGWI